MKKEKPWQFRPADRWCPMARVVCDEMVPAGNRFPAGHGLSGYWNDALCLTTICAVFVGDPDTGHCGMICR